MKNMFQQPIQLLLFKTRLSCLSFLLLIQLFDEWLRLFKPQARCEILEEVPLFRLVTLYPLTPHNSSKGFVCTARKVSLRTWATRLRERKDGERKTLFKRIKQSSLYKMEISSVSRDLMYNC